VSPEQHIAAFNEAVVSGEWAAFVSRFDDDAVLEFVGPPVGPFRGRAAIAEAYRTSPPDDTIAPAGAPHQDDVELIIPYRWVATGAAGTMRITDNGRLITRLVVTFD
jgi:hypothetical protein